MAMTPKDRSFLLSEYYRLGDENRRMASTNADYDQRQAVIAQSGSILQRYFDSLPRELMSRCPLTSMPLVKALDPWGVDGFWWQEMKIRNTPEPPPPSTFRVLRGALSLNGLPPLGGHDQAHVGPDVPYVIPRILEMPTMVMVVSSLHMQNGYIAYPLAYYSTQPPPIGSLVATWRMQTYSYLDPQHGHAWSMPSDPWDFELRPWIERGKVFWIEPGDPQLIVKGGPWVAYPFKDLQGQRLVQTIVRDRLLASPPPDGTPYEPFE